MFKLTVEAIKREYSGARAMQHIAELLRYHRIQASPGFREAANYCCRVLSGYGLQAEILTFPAREGVQYWAQPLFQEWDASEATLHLVDPAEQAGKLADYGESKCALIQRSAGADDLTAEVVLLEDGESPEEYEGLDLAGKVVLTKGDWERVRELAVNRGGAAGVLYDGLSEMAPVRQRMDLPDTRAYVSFWWKPGDKKCFGFVLTPRQGDQLRALVRERQREGKPPVRVRAHVNSRLYDGHMEAVSGLIAGQSDEEVLVVAHLCHPQTSANDNASGCAAVLELARTLMQLIRTKQIESPRRGIRLLLVAEIMGTFAYLATHEHDIPRMVAGINLDMVGENQDLCKSVFVIERLPAASASFSADLIERLREEWLTGAESINAAGDYALFRHAVIPFGGGSDHYVLVDPGVGVPTPMLNQWPDRYWHTADDTLDKVDPRMLGVAGGLAAAYAHFVANAGDREAYWLGQEMRTRFRARLGRAVQDAIAGVLSAPNGEALGRERALVERTIRFEGECAVRAMRSLQRLSLHADEVGKLVSAVEAAVGEELTHALQVVARRADELGLGAVELPEYNDGDSWQRQAEGMVACRKFRGPLPMSWHLHRLPQQERDAVWAKLKAHRGAYYAMSQLANYWIDGVRTVADIADAVEMETGKRNVELLVWHFTLLDRLGLIVLHSASTPAARAD